MAKFTVVVPVNPPLQRDMGEPPEEFGKPDKTNIPFLGASRRYDMTEDEFKQWIEMFLADKSMGNMFYVERRGR